MSSLLAALRPHARLAFSLGGLFMSSAASSSSSAVTGAVSAATRDPTKTKYILRAASPTAQREVPTPLVFVSAGGWDTDSARGCV
jgi:K+-transporting ATPase c subunit